MNRFQFLRALILGAGSLCAGRLLGAPSATPTPSPAAVLPTGPTVVFKTSMGDITVDLDPIRAPFTVANFLAYADSKAYNGTIFHRVIQNFCVQGGGYSSDLTREVGAGHPCIKNEARNGLRNTEGTIAMARPGLPDSATSQFFFNLVDNSNALDPDGTVSPDGYAVFGKVKDGWDVVKKMGQVVTTSRRTPQGEMDDMPLEPIILNGVVRI